VKGQRLKGARVKGERWKGEGVPGLQKQPYHIYIYIYIYDFCFLFLCPKVIFIIDLPVRLPETFRKLPDCGFSMAYLRGPLTRSA